MAIDYKEEVRKIKVQMVKELRAETGAGMMDCKKALKEADWDWNAAKELLKIMPVCGISNFNYFGEARRKIIEEANKLYEDSLIAQIASHAVFTEEFKEKGCYVKENIDIKGKEVTVMVMDDSWIGLKKDEFKHLLSCRSQMKY